MEKRERERGREREGGIGQQCRNMPREGGEALSPPCVKIRVESMFRKETGAWSPFFFDFFNVKSVVIFFFDYFKESW